MNNPTLTDTLDAALRPYLPGAARRRFVAERAAPVVAEEFLRRLDVALARFERNTPEAVL